MKRVTIEISDEIHKTLKLLSYTEDVSLREILKKAVLDYISSNKADLIHVIDNRGAVEEWN